MDTVVITGALGSATVLFGAAATLSVLATGFWLGLQWMRRTGFKDTRGRDSEADPRDS